MAFLDIGPFALGPKFDAMTDTYDIEFFFITVSFKLFLILLLIFMNVYGIFFDLLFHRYRLHWWVFVPYAPLRKVAEVMLFGDQDLQESVYENIFISVCQWPKDLSKILVYGCR